MNNKLSTSHALIASLNPGVVNDKHSQLNPTLVERIVCPTSLEELTTVIKMASSSNQHISIAGGKHAMGGQQFRRNGVLLDSTHLNKVLGFDFDRGLIEVEAGIQWPELIRFLQSEQQNKPLQWTIAQKQTGCDFLSLGGALAANIHGRQLCRPPIIADVEDFTIVMHNGNILKCNREHNKHLFSLAIGGYGLFGVIYSVTLRLIPKTILQRSVELVPVSNLISELSKRTASGAVYGDFQFSIDSTSSDFLNAGILSTYSPVESAQPPAENKLLSVENWQELLFLAHTNKSAAFDMYSRHYLSTHGQLYYSDTFQLATYINGYHEHVDSRIPNCTPGSELITELYVPRHQLASFMKSAAELLRDRKADLIYGTVRLIEKDSESFLAWAHEPWACIVLNLHVEHTPHGIAHASTCFVELINLAINFGGSYYLTYHRFAVREQLLSCYPQFPDFLSRKQAYDQADVFCSDWYMHYRGLISGN